MKKWDRRRVKPQPKFQLRRWERWIAKTFLGPSYVAVACRADIRRFLGRFSEGPPCSIEPLLSGGDDR